MVFEITMFVVSLPRTCVYFINLFMFMNIIPHTGIIKKTWQRREKTIKRCRGFRVTSFTLPLPRRHSIPSRALDTKSGEKEQTVWLMSWAYTSQIFICFRFVSSAFELIKIRNRATNFNKFNECRRLDYSRHSILKKWALTFKLFCNKFNF